MDELRGARVILRPKRQEDAANDYAWRCDPELARLDAAPVLRSSYYEFLMAYREEPAYPNARSRRFAVDEVAAGKHIGNAMIYEIDHERAEAELGIMIGDKAYWGTGYGTDAVRLLVAHVFTQLPLARIYLATLDWNLRAHRSFAKCGFAPCGSMRREGQSFILMELFRHQWEARQQPALRGTAPQGEGIPPKEGA
ncbi:MAG: N-acetyltransferase [Dehalococcoidia bacterium]|nr:N-acetyltransferase [Dehalococcoidia bacterium]